MKIVATTSERLKEIIRERNLSQSKIARMTNIPKTTMNDYCAGRFEPKSNNLMTLSKVLNVEPRWLMGYDIPKNKNISVRDDIDTLLGQMNEQQLLAIKDILNVVINMNNAS